uniref:Uncharacterized protein n=1 Tax=Acrobeloides nanus TaxID=290746 RepID=A0A914DIR4_9BILA
MAIIMAVHFSNSIHSTFIRKPQNLNHSVMSSSCFLDVDEDKDPINTECLTKHYMLRVVKLVNVIGSNKGSLSTPSPF